MRSNVVGLVAGLVLAAGCGNSTSPYGGGGGGGGHSTTITVNNNFFSPTPDTVAAGATVAFTWAMGAVTHNVTWDSGPTAPPNSGDKGSGTYTTPALSAGTYAYHCTIHVKTYGMRGKIVVQ